MIVDLIFVIAVVGLLIAIYKIKFSKENIDLEIDQATKMAQQEKNNQPVTNAANSQVDNKQEIQETKMNSEASGWQGEEEGSDIQGEEQVMDMRKQLRKQQKQKEKQHRKQQQEQMLNAEKDKRQKYQKQSEERQRQEEERRKKQEQIIEQLREDERKRKEEQFNKWKNMFSVEEEGKEKLSADEEQKKIEAFNRQLFGVLKKNKLSLLEDLSHKFKLSTKELVDKIKQLQQDKIVTGIFDQRGKYLVVEEEEWNAIKKYISVRGRVKKSDFMIQCAKLIKIPENVEEDLLKLIVDQPEKEKP